MPQCMQIEVAEAFRETRCWIGADRWQPVTSQGLLHQDLLGIENRLVAADVRRACDEATRRVCSSGISQTVSVSVSRGSIISHNFLSLTGPTLRLT